MERRALCPPTAGSSQLPRFSPWTATSSASVSQNLLAPAGSFQPSIAEHEHTSTQLTPAAITKAYKALSTARHKLLIASLKLANSKYTLECNQAALVLNRVINGGNETTRKAQLRDHLAELHQEIHERTIDRDRAQCRFDRAKLQVDELELQLKLLEISLLTPR